MDLQHRAGEGPQPGIDLEDLALQPPDLLGEAATGEAPTPAVRLRIAGSSDQIGNTVTGPYRALRPTCISGISLISTTAFLLSSFCAILR